MAKNTPSAATIAMRTAGGPHFVANFHMHMMLGNHVAGLGAHSGLHSLNVALAQYPALQIANVLATDSRNPAIYAADVRLTAGKAVKRSTFFPATMNYGQILAAVTAAWIDSRTYSPQSEVYGQLANAYGLSWAGLADVGGQRIWIGSPRAGTAGNPIETAFPAVDNKFF